MRCAALYPYSCASSQFSLHPALCRLVFPEKIALQSGNRNGGCFDFFDRPLRQFILLSAPIIHPAEESSQYSQICKFPENRGDQRRFSDFMAIFPDKCFSVMYMVRVNSPNVFFGAKKINSPEKACIRPEGLPVNLQTGYNTRRRDYRFVTGVVSHWGSTWYSARSSQLNSRT